jgi:PAS domain S-box-containing protein
MIEAPIPENESERLSALNSYNILDTLPEEDFNDLTQLASYICQTPIALISLVDPLRQWFKATCGLDATQTHRNIAFCAHAILQPGLMIVEDALTDHRFHDNPLVTSEPYIRFYAGAPLRTSNGINLGTLCVIDQVPRDLSESQQNALIRLSRQVVALMELRRHIAIQKEHEEALALRERSIESASNGILIVDAQAPDMPTVYCNLAFEKITGYSKEEVLGQNCRFLHGKDKDQPELDRLRTAIHNGKESRVELRNYRKDGSFFWNELYVAPVRNSQGDISHFIGVQTDITEAKRARLENLELAAIVESCEEAIIGKTAEGIIRSWNKGAERLYGYTEEEAIGKSIRIIFPPNKLSEFEEIMGNIRSGHGIQQFETIRHRKDGTDIQVAITISPIIDPRGGFIGSSTLAYDITKRKQREKDLAEKTQELARSNQDLQQFAYVASHDLQEPLRMVSSYTQLLGKRYKGKLDADADEFIGFAVDGANRMQRLIRDLLEYSRVGAKEIPIEPTDCNLILQSVMNNLSSSIKDSGADITIDPLPTLRGNPTQLTQLFQNLLGNALKFRGEQPLTIQVTAKKDNGNWEFSIQDNGIGIPGDQQNRIFDIFQRLHSRTEYEGTGIGLAICKKIVESHGGSMWVESEPGAGSKFRFTLPAGAGIFPV